MTKGAEDVDCTNVHACDWCRSSSDNYGFKEVGEFYSLRVDCIFAENQISNLFDCQESSIGVSTFNTLSNIAALGKYKAQNRRVQHNLNGRWSISKSGDVLNITKMQGGTSGLYTGRYAH